MKKNLRSWLFVLCVPGFSICATAQKKPSFSVSGTAGIQYEYYGLDRSPTGWTGFIPRKPWNQVRYIFNPEFQFGKNFSLPFNFNISQFPSNYAGPYSGFIPGGPRQSFSQWITNPVNSIALNPKYKWAELQLGTQYLHYSDLSTGDIAVFGAGFSLHPGTYKIKFFNGVSQEAINYFSGPPVITGAFKRNNWMFQLGKEKEGKYDVAFNMVKAIDLKNSVTTPPLTIKPQEGFTLSLDAKTFFGKGWYLGAEGAQGYFTRNILLPQDTSKKSFKPFIEARTSTVRDFATDASLGKKTKNFDLGIRFKLIGAGFQTPGYPYLQPDRLEYTVHTRFNAVKNKDGTYKINVIASVGDRVNNRSNTTLRASQFVGSLNWFTQFNEHWNLNVTFNNFGFQAPGGLNPYGIKNVSNDVAINPSYTWSNDKVINLLNFNYEYSKYSERDVMTGLTTANNTHTALLTYVPTYLKKKISPDYSLLYFLNKVPGFKFNLITFSSGLGAQLKKNAINLRAQLQYNYSKTNSFTADNNITASANMDWKVSKKLKWNVYAGTNHFKYGNEITPNHARYLETNFRTGFLYTFDTKKNK